MLIKLNSLNHHSSACFWENSKQPQTASKGLLILFFSLILQTISGCNYKAPTVTGTDQVHNPNIEMTALKDNKFESMSWPAVDNIMLGLVDDPENGPGCAVGVVRDHKIIYLQGYGYAWLPKNADPGEKWGVATMGAVGSVSKSFTAVAALQMMDKGLMNFNQEVDTFLSTSYSDLGNVEIFDLLAHSSGVGGATKSEAFQPNWGSDNLVQQCINDDPNLETPICLTLANNLARPATAFTWYQAHEYVPGFGTSSDLDIGVYSNVGYSVLGAIIDSIAHNETTSDGYEAFIWDNVGRWSNNLLEGGHLLSLALTHSWRKNDIPHRAVGYIESGLSVSEAWQNTGHIEGWEGPAGGWALTIGDLSRFMIALDEGSFFNNDLFVTAMRTEATNLDDFSDHYGLGMFIGAGNQNSPDYWHGGVIGPHKAVWTWWENYSGQEIGVAMLCNRSDISMWTQKSNTAVIAGIAANTGNPNPPEQLKFQPVKISGLKDKVFVLDYSKSWQSAPKGAFIPFTSLKNTLLLTPFVYRSKLFFNLAEGRVTKQGITFSDRDTTTLKTRSFSTPWFKARATSIALETIIGDVEISGLQVEGAFTDRGEAITDASLSGTIDVRQFSTLADLSWKSICRDVAEAGASCQPCADGNASCIYVRYDGLSGSATKQMTSSNRRY